MTVTVFVHPINQEAHPTVPGGYRWAVHLGGNPQNLHECLNAGWCPTTGEAALEGEMVGVTVAKALLAVGYPCEYHGVRHVEHDPIPAGADTLQVR